MAASSRRTRSSRRRSSPTRLRRPVQLTWPRIQEIEHDSFRPAAARADDRLGGAGPAAGLAGAGSPRRPPPPRSRARLGATAWLVRPDAAAVGGRGAALRRSPMSRSTMSRPISASETGSWRGEAHSYTGFFTESFIDELARTRGHGAARPSASRCSATIRGWPACLATATSIGGWDGGAPGQRHGHRLPQRLRLAHRRPGRGRGERRPAGCACSRAVARGRLRAGGQSRDRQAADRGRADPRHVGGARQAARHRPRHARGARRSAPTACRPCATRPRSASN